MADDFLAKKKDSGSILDLARAVVSSEEEFRKLMDKVPDFKMRPVKVRQEEIKIREKHKEFKFKTGKKDTKVLKDKYNFQDPVPLEMKELKLEDIYPVPIDWRMLTTLRPKAKVDEDYFSRLIELGKSQMKTLAQDKRTWLTEPLVRNTKNKSGIVEGRIISCPECGVEYCDGKVCGLFQYDSFTRVQPEQKKKPDDNKTSDPKTKKKHKARSRSKTKRKQKSKSPVKTTTTTTTFRKSKSK